MPDIGLDWVPETQVASVSVDANDLSTDSGLQTAIILSLFTDRRAEPGDVLPVGDSDRRGWWADAAPVVNGDKFGSRLWLLERSKRTPSVLSRAEAYSSEALQWLIDDKVAKSISVSASFLPDVEGLALAVSITKPSSDVVRFRFSTAWSAEGL